MRTLFYIFAAGALLSMAACNKTDEEAPVVAEIRVNGSLAGDHVHIDAGAPVEISVRVTDNEALGQLKIDIHADDDGHSHDGHSHGSGSAEGQWEELDIINLEGTDQTVVRTYTVPNTVRGEWHLGVRVLDEAGNESPERIVELDIDNDIIPLITVESVNGQSPNDEVEVEAGDMIVFVGTVTDNAGLDEVHIEVKLEDGTVVYDEEYELGGAESFDLSTANFTLPDVGSAHHGEIHIEAKNINGYESEREIDLHFED